MYRCKKKLRYIEKKPTELIFGGYESTLGESDYAVDQWNYRSKKRYLNWIDFPFTFKNEIFYNLQDVYTTREHFITPTKSNIFDNIVKVKAFDPRFKLHKGDIICDDKVSLNSKKLNDDVIDAMTYMFQKIINDK